MDYLIRCAAVLKEISQYDIFVVDSHGELMAYFSKGLWQEYFDYIKNFSIKKAVFSHSVETLYVYVDYVIERKGQKMRLSYLLKKCDVFSQVRIITYCRYISKKEIILYEGLAVAVPNKLRKGKIYKWVINYGNGKPTDVCLDIYLKFRGCKKCCE